MNVVYLRPSFSNLMGLIQKSGKKKQKNTLTCSMFQCIAGLSMAPSISKGMLLYGYKPMKHSMGWITRLTSALLLNLNLGKISIITPCKNY